MPEYHCIPYPTKAQIASTPICEVTCADGSEPLVATVPEPTVELGLTFGALLLAALARRT